MRKPKRPRHTISALREIIGLSQGKFAELCGRSRPTIQAIELGNLSLSPALAKDIGREAGVSVAWLLDGDISAPPVCGTIYGLPPEVANLDAVKLGIAYTKERFERHRAYLDAKETPAEMIMRGLAGKGFEDDLTGALKGGYDAGIVEDVRRLLEATKDNPDRDLIRWRIKKVIREQSEAYLNDPVAPQSEI